MCLKCVWDIIESFFDRAALPIYRFVGGGFVVSVSAYDRKIHKFWATYARWILIQRVRR